MRKKKLIVSLILFVFGFIIIYFSILFNSPIVLKQDKIELNSKIELYSLFDKRLGKYVTSNYTINTSKLGKKEIEVVVKRYFELVSYKFEIEIVDTKGPNLSCNKEVKTFVGREIDLLKNVSLVDNSLELIEVKVIGEYDFNKNGTYDLKYYAKDLSDNETSCDFKLIVDDIEESYYITSKGYKLVTRDGVSTIDNLIIANKSYSLPSGYGNGLTSDALTSFNKMKEDASKNGMNLTIESGFRSYSDQTIVYNKWVNLDGKEIADTYSARPGYSEHQTGLAMDLNLIHGSFESTKEFKWLNENAYKYGFILRYPKDKIEITGYIYEPWHYRYVGLDLASKLYNNGNWITLEEYFGISSKY